MASVLKVNELQHTGGTAAMTIDGSGRVALPQNPYLMCNCSGYSGNVTPQSFTGKIPLQNVISSRGIVLNASTYEWTVPVTGLYNISGAIRINGDYLYTYWTINDYTSSPARVQTDKLVIAHGYANTGFTTCCGSVLHLLETGKNYGFNINASSASAVGLDATQTWLDIHLVG